MEDGRGQAVLGDADSQHPARLGQGLEDGHIVAHHGQVVGSGQACRPRADNGHLTPVLFNLRDFEFVYVELLAGKALQSTYGQSVIQVIAFALLLARVIAHQSADSGQGVGPANQPVCLLEFALSDQGDVALDIHVHRAGHLAGWRLFLVNHEGIRHRLGEGAVDGPSLDQPLVEFAVHLDRAVLDAVPAAGALVYVNVSRLVPHRGPETALLALHTHDLGIGHQLDVGITGHVHHFGSQDAGRTIQSGKGLVQLGHAPADAGLPFHQIHFEAGISDIQRGLDARYPAPYHQGRWRGIVPSRLDFDTLLIFIHEFPPPRLHHSRELAGQRQDA